ncbi:unnamed protein product [Cylindrotheca closterium]|uniref:Uncharacterized protein n=1 Tax=Cylindrotheca closterium TaxID=2856 RepID=A0AAD2CNH8_9STRA|nr:unnamed protein product [Cylindrotheca closterium]
MPHNKILESKFVSVDLESSLGIIKDDTTTVSDDSNSQQPQQKQEQQEQQQEQGTSTIETPSSPSSQAKFVCQPTNNNSEGVAFPMLLDSTLNPFANQKVTRTSDTYPFANRGSKRKLDDDDDDENNDMDESDTDKRPRTTSMSSFEPIPVSDHEVHADIGSMMMLMQGNDNDDENDDDGEDDGKSPSQDNTFLINKIGDWSQPPKKEKKNENGYTIVPNDRDHDDAAWVNIDLSDTEVEDEDDLLSMLEEEAKESGFVLENIGDRQSFWNHHHHSNE